MAVKASRRFWQKKRYWFLTLFLLGIIYLLCTSRGLRVILQTAPNKPKGAAASPALQPGSLEQWETIGRPKALIALQNEIYGRHFDISPPDGKMTLLDPAAFNGAAHLYEINLSAVFENTVSAPQAPSRFKAVLLIPNSANDAVPVIMMENFCPNHSVIPHPAIAKPEGAYFNCNGQGFMHSVFTFFFGRYITTPPINMILEHGYGIAAIYPHEFVPDDGIAGLKALKAFFPDINARERPGAIMVWAKQFSVLREFLDSEDELDISDVIAYGHSRFGKSALLAAAFDLNIDGVIAHQSGTGGASLSRYKPGETVSDITAGYPHWFARAYAEYAGKEDELTVDQHYLLAAIAPRPVMLGNAKRDVWSDPNGAFRAAQGADQIYELYGREGLNQTKLGAFDETSEIAFWMRPGTHGVTEDDWPAFLDFLNAHFK